MTKSYLYRKILIIEDDEIFLNPLVKFLTHNQFQVNLATNALSGISLQDDINFDLIITDLKMEGMSGVDAIDKITVKYPEAKIIVMSGYIGQEEEFKGIQRNPHVCAVFEKPVDFTELLNKIKEVLS